MYPLEPIKAYGEWYWHEEVVLITGRYSGMPRVVFLDSSRGVQVAIFDPPTELTRFHTVYDGNEI